MKNCIDLNVVLDCSGSMSMVKYPMEEAINGFISNQKSLSMDCNFTMAQFDDQYEVTFIGVPINSVNKVFINPRGSTALLDAIGTLMDETGNRLSALPEHERPNKVLFVILTDGLENTSRKFNRQQIFDKITLQRDIYKWEFVFLGANQDAIASATDIGILAGNALSYEQTAGGIKIMNSKLCCAARAYSSGNEQNTANFFSKEDDAKTTLVNNKATVTAQSK